MENQNTNQLIKKSLKLKNYKFSSWDIEGKNRESFILSFYSKKEAIKYAEEWQTLNPLKNLQVYLDY